MQKENTRKIRVFCILALTDLVGSHYVTLDKDVQLDILRRTQQE